MRRVLTPQLVVHACSWVFCRERNLDAARLGEVLPEEVRGAGLDRLAILHHRLDAERLHRAREALAFALLAGEDRQREAVARERLVDPEHALGFLARLRLGLVRGVAFLPEKLGGPQEEARAHFPADDIGPLIDEDRQVAVRLHPLRVGRADDRLARGADDQRLGQLGRRRGTQAAAGRGLEPVMRDDGALLGEAFHVLGLLREIAQRDEEREVRVLVPGRLERGIEEALHVLPDAVAPRLDDHAAAHIRRLGHLGGAHHLLVPLGEVFLAGRA